MSDSISSMPAPPAESRPNRLLLRPFRYARHHPRRAAAWAVVVLAAFVGLYFGGRYGWARYHLRAARIEIERGHNAMGIRHIEECRDVFPENRELMRLSARVAWRSGSWDLAESILDRYWALHGQDDDLVLERLVLQAAHGEVETAGPGLLARIERHDPSEALCREALATGLLLRFRWTDAQAFIDRWLEDYPDAVPALLLRGKLQEQQEKATDAMQTYRRVLELDPEHDEARLRLSTLLLRFSQGEEAVGHLRILKERLPELAEVQVQWVRALELQGQNVEARAALEDCVARFPNHPGALAELGTILNREGDFARAEQCLERSLRGEPGNIATLHQYAEALTRNSKLEEAAKERQKIKEIEVDSERVAQLIRGTLQRSPNDAKAMQEIAEILFRVGQFSEAMRWSQNSLQLDPNYAPTHRTLALLYERQGKTVLASRHMALASQADNQSRKKP